MDPVSFGQVFFIWMLLFVTLGNCAISKSKLHNVLSSLDGSIIGFKCLFNVLDQCELEETSIAFLVERT
jgi:hypothetical protein